ncbi:protein NRDE2 homolog [Dendronephthya gigantea]|uniref:protein NRDE2 homolog n=1 Tax=Dendronephthya gigantea TaxID=151771 RepID=UPI001068E8AB|nr:protein NRDE2 homolog [Dendronephthya gigantea]
MADEHEKVDISGKSPLFPIISSNSCDIHTARQTSGLFPSVPVCISEEKESFDWLSNASYNIHNHTEIPTNIEEECESPSSHSSNEDEISKETRSDQTEEKHVRKRRKKDKSTKHKKHKHKKQKKHKSTDDPKLTNLPSTIWIEESGLEVEKAFRIHRKPDYNNREFGGLYRLDIALHNQNPKLRCLGLSRDQEIEPKSGRKEKKKSKQRYWGSFVSSDDASTLLGQTGKTGFGFSNNFSYVPLELPVAVNDENKESSAGDNDQPVSVILSKTKDLNQRVGDNPNDIQAWLDLADLQSQQAQSSYQTSNTFSKSGIEDQKKSSKMLLEKKAAVLEKAVEKNPSSVELIVACMNVCAQTLDSEAILEKWRKRLFIQPQKTLLWKHYLMFCQSSFSAFTFSTTLAIYTKCFTTLSAIQSGKFTSHSPEDDIESGMVEIFVQFCQFLKQAGQTEKAIAAFQALIEFNCFCPEGLQETRSMTSFFETFWDSEVPRFGEENAQGWNSWMKDREETSHPVALSEIFPRNDTQEEISRQEKILSSHSDRHASWLKLESSREAEQWRPKKTSDEEEENEDPDRIVLFQDISFVLFQLTDESLKFQLLCYFLCFLGNRVDFQSTSSDSKSSAVQPERLLPVLIEDEKQIQSIIDGNHLNFACSWNSFERPLENHDIAYRMFIRNIFNQALGCFSADLQTFLAIHWLRFERNILASEVKSKKRKQCYKAVRKLAKSLLKLEQHRNNLRLWFAFVQVEWVNENWMDARGVVTSLLEQSLNMTDKTSTMEYYHFVRSYCELEMGLGSALQNDKVPDMGDLRKKILPAISVLVNKAPGNVPKFLTPAQILKTHKALEEKGALMLAEFQSWYDDIVSAQGEKEFFVDFMICYAFFQYWSLGLVAAKSVVDSALSAVRSNRTHDGGVVLSRSKYEEDILVLYCKLLKFHSKNNVSPVKPLRDSLLSSLSAFQENPFFLHSYVMLELKSCTSYSIRRYFDSLLDRSRTPIPWLFAILYESQRQKTIQNSYTSTHAELSQTGVIYRLRSLYERAINHPSARHCVAVWRSYMKFEADNGDLRQAKAIFYQSLQCCAWSKLTYLDAIKLFPEIFQDVYDMMEEKELRIRTPFEELDLLLET